MYSEEQLLPISALQHLVFCERQWGLMYLEHIWAENRLTVEGGILHSQVDTPGTEVRMNLRVARGLRLASFVYGLVGIADIVEFHPVDEFSSSQNEFISLEGVDGKWRPYPVEYKHGKPKIDDCDLVQLCAQALCLEEMMSAKISDGAIFYGQPHKRLHVVFDLRLRDKTIEASRRLHRLTQKGKTPKGLYSKKCRSCSVFDYCLPKQAGRKSAKRYIKSEIDSICHQVGEGEGE